MRELSVFAAAEDAGASVCLVEGARVLSFSDVAAAVERVANGLVARGVAPGDRVAVTPIVTLDSVLTLYALFELGCPAVLLHPRLTAIETASIIDTARPALTLEAVPVGKSSPSLRIAAVPPERTLAIAYTSGTNGAPRGVVLSRAAFVASHGAHSANLGWESDDKWLLGMPPAHVGGLSILTRCLIARRAVVLCPGPFEAGRTIKMLEANDVTLLSVVPSMLSRLLAHDVPRWTPNASLRAVLVGGAPLPEHLRAAGTARGIPILTTYGCTEACSQVTTQRLDQIGEPGCGQPLEGISLRVRGGEIQIHGPTLMDGYLAETDSDSTWTDDGWFRTRDGGSVDQDGQLHVAGRLDDMILSGGENVAPLEVEAALESVAAIAGAVVFSLPSQEWGEEVVAAVESDDGTLDRTTLRAHLNERLASFKHPKRVAILESLPLNRSGKIDRKRTKELATEFLEPI